MKHTQLPMWVNPDCRSVGPVIRRDSTITGRSRTLAIPWRGELFSFCSIAQSSGNGSNGATIFCFLRTIRYLMASR